MIGYVLCGLFFVVLGFVAGWACDWFFGDNNNEDEDDVPEPYLLDSSKLSDYERECLKNSLQLTETSMLKFADAVCNLGRPYYVDADLAKGASDEEIERWKEEYNND